MKKKVRPVLVESKEKSCKGDLVIDPTGLGVHIADTQPSLHNKQELTLISLEDERIEDGDYNIIPQKDGSYKIGMYSPLKEWVKNEYDPRKDGCIKVIARQSQISPEYISKFIEQYNRMKEFHENFCECSIEDIEIEMEEEYWESRGGWQTGGKFKVFKKPEIGEYTCILDHYPSKPKLVNGFVTIEKNKFGNNIGYVPLEDVNTLLHSHKSSFIGLEPFRRLQEDIVQLFQSYKKPITYTE